MLGLKVSRRQFSIHLRIDPGHGKPDPCEHIIRCDPVDVVLVDLRSHNDPIVVIVVPTPPPGGSPLLDGLGPSGGIFVGIHIFPEGVRAIGPAGPADQTHRGATESPRGGEPSTTVGCILGVITATPAATRVSRDLQRVSVPQGRVLLRVHTRWRGGR